MTHKWVQWKRAQFTLARCCTGNSVLAFGNGGSHHPTSSQSRAMQCRYQEQQRERGCERNRKKAGAKLGNCIKWLLYFDTLWLGFRFLVFISIPRCFAVFVFFALLYTVVLFAAMLRYHVDPLNISSQVEHSHTHTHTFSDTNQLSRTHSHTVFASCMHPKNSFLNLHPFILVNWIYVCIYTG